MSKTVKPIPDDMRGAVPYLSIKGAAAALEFYQRAFGARTSMCMPMPDGRVGHAQITIGDAKIMLADEFPEMGFRGPHSLGGTPVRIHVYVDDVDALVDRAAKAGATVERPPTDEFYGDRSSTLVDPYGHSWLFATHIEDVPADELQRRAATLFGGGAAGSS